MITIKQKCVAYPQEDYTGVLISLVHLTVLSPTAGFYSQSTFNNFIESSSLRFRTQNIEGSITMNGKERNISQFRKLSAYIMQDNQLHANLTVEEAMNVAANLKLSQKVDKTEKYHVVSISIFIFCMLASGFCIF
jgi:hypothetical protein